MRIDVRGPADVTGADLRTTSDVEVLNPGVHIATVNAKGRLAIDVTVEQGKGYAPAERKQAASTIGVIPVDAIFSPVRRVAFVVEPARVKVSTDFDRVLLDIETDGSISPREALASAGQTLRGLLSIVARARRRGPRAWSSARSASPSRAHRTWTFPSRTSTCRSARATASSAAQINTVGELIERSAEDLLAITNFGQKSLDEVLQRLDERGLSLREAGV